MADSGSKPQYLVEYSLRYAGGDPNDFFVQHVSIHDRLNDCYNVRVRCHIAGARQESNYQACAKRRLKDVELTLRRRFPDGMVLETKVLGVILSVDRTNVLDADDPFVITIVPAMAVLSHQCEGGTWHNRTIPDVLRKVLRKALPSYGRTFDDKITRSYPEHDIIVRRPDENLLDFVKKLCARVGINFYFRHDGAVETLVLCDSNDGFLDGNQRLPKSYPFKPTWVEHATDGEEQVLEANRTSSLGPTEIEYRGFDVGGSPKQRVRGATKADGGHPQAKVQINDAFRVNERENPDAQHKRIAQLHGEVAQNRTNVVDMRTSITGALAGRRYKFEVEPGDVRDYIVMAVDGGGQSFAPPGADYMNNMQLVPVQGDGGEAINVRSIPPFTDVTVPAIMRAEVVAVENDPVDVDGLLRCRLRFAWDEQTAEVPTTYVSVLQSVAGTHGGSHVIPRAGDRCLVSFIGGNLERPVILGFLYDKENLPPPMGPTDKPVSLPTAAHLLGWNHASIGDKSRQSILSMDVTAGSEMFYFNAPWNWRQDVGHDCDVRIKHDELRQIGHDVRETVDNDYIHHVKQKRKDTVDADHSLTVGGGWTIDVTGSTRATFTGSVVATCNGGLTSHIERGNTENVNTGDRVTRVASGSVRYAVANSFVVAASSVSIGCGGFGGSGPAAGASLALGQTALLECVGGSVVRSGPSSMGTSTEGVSLRGPTAQIRDQAGGVATMANGSYVVEVPQGITFRCGATELRLTQQGVFINGQQLILQGARTQIRTADLDIDRPDGSGTNG